MLCAALHVRNRDPFGAAIGLWLVGVSLARAIGTATHRLGALVVLLALQKRRLARDALKPAS